MGMNLIKQSLWYIITILCITIFCLSGAAIIMKFNLNYSAETIYSTLLILTAIVFCSMNLLILGTMCYKVFLKGPTDHD